MAGFAFEPVEEVVGVYQCVADVHCFVHGAGEELVEAENGFACQVFLMDDLRMVFDVGGRGDFAAQLCDGECAACFFQVAPVDEFFLDGEYVDLFAGLIHGCQTGEDQLVTVVVEHFGT